MKFFVYSWDISETLIYGPFDTREDAKAYAFDNDDLECAAILELPCEIIRTPITV